MKTLDIKRILKNSTILLRKLKLGIDIFKVLEYYIEYVIVLFKKIEVRKKCLASVWHWKRICGGRN